MALVKEIIGSSVLDRSSSVTLINHFNQRNSVNPVLIPLEKRRIQVRKVVRTTPVAAISDNSVRFVPEEAVKFKVRAVLTVRNKNKEDFKETIVKQLDAFTDKIGRNVVLQLISTEIDPSKPFSLSGLDFHLFLLILLLSICFRQLFGFSHMGLLSVLINATFIMLWSFFLNIKS